MTSTYAPNAANFEVMEQIKKHAEIRFWDIPSPWWQASTVLVGVGAALSLLVAITATAACCITYVVHTGTARLAGGLQLFAVLGKLSDGCF
ncbi:Lipoma HMGIC fusion partner homolog-like Protein [Gryllus bimaculatus]|nr:Lipoma HMGIC fusion partner homolog-like Protein [Gryllus bimaculatus]